MTVTSFRFLVFLGIAVLFYYAMPRKWRWMELLVMSVLFYCLAAAPYTIIYPAASAVTAYAGTNLFAVLRRRGWEKAACAVAALAVAANAMLWLVVQADGLWQPVMLRLGFLIPALQDTLAWSFLAAMGMGYYTLQVIGYIMDCYWETVKPQTNILKLFLFVCFFPQMVTGPISRYAQMEQLYEGHPFRYADITRGMQRILWGFFKKLVLAERAGIIVNGIWNGLDAYTGYYPWIALMLFPVQMYADFSGGIPICA